MTQSMSDPNSNVTDRLRTDVVSGYFPPNTRLIEAKLTKRYDTGRASVRSAIVELAKEGLVIREVNRGATVRALSRSETIEIYEARCAIEILNARRAATNATAEDRNELRALVARMTETFNDPDTSEFVSTGEALGRLVSRIARHRVANELIRTLRNQSYQTEPPLTALPNHKQQFLDDAVATFEAIASGDEDAAEHAVRTHYKLMFEALRD